MIIRFAKLEELDAILRLNEEFCKEKCCNAIITDNIDFFKSKNILVAIIDDLICGYAYGDINGATKTTTYHKKDDKIFYLEELYVKKQFRNKHIGTKLFEYLEQYAKDNHCKGIELNASSKDYKKLLHFYIDELGMSFFSAFLYKKLN